MPRVKKEKKLHIEDIKKNPEIEKKNFIHKFIEHEHEIMICTTALFMVLICLVIFIGAKTVEYSDKVEIYYDGNLKIRYNKDFSGVSDIISLSKDNIVDLRSGEKSEYNFSVINDSLIGSKFNVYLEIDDEMIKLDECKDDLVDLSAVRYSINDSKEKSITNLMDEGYLIHSGSIKANKTNDYVLKMWIDGNSLDNYDKYHFHARIIIIDED